MVQVVDGAKIAAEIQSDLKKELGAIMSKSGRKPKLVSVVTDNDIDRSVYIKAQARTAASVGIDFAIEKIKSSISEIELIGTIKKLNDKKDVTAIIIHHPLPKGLKHDKITSFIIPEKDAEGIHPFNLGKIFRMEETLVPCTPGAVMNILERAKIPLYGKDVVIVGHSAIVGKPLSMMMLNEMATTTVCHLGTYEEGDIKSYTNRADILIIATGKPKMVKADWVKKGVIIIDVGINRVDGKIVGDVDFDDIKDKASLITPVPGGVGPITVSILMRNVMRAFRMQNENI